MKFVAEKKVAASKNLTFFATAKMEESVEWGKQL